MDDVFEILSNARRRFTIRYLQENDAPVNVRELSEAIAAGENGGPVDGVSSKERKRVYVALYQCHLPKMDAKNIISYDKSRGTIERGPNMHHVMDSLVRIEPPTTDPGSPRDGSESTTNYSKFGLAVSVLLAITYIGMADITPVEAAGVALLSALITGFGLYFWYTDRGESRHRDRSVENEQAVGTVVDSSDD